MARSISRESGGVKYVGSCESNGFFMPGMMFCTSCGSQVNPHVMENDVSLTCHGCGNRVRVFKDEEEQQQFLSREWTLLQKVCEGKARR
jgi:predicted RNA-binding Zn-ribbon protein involved in translation (DUF1610 family)